MNWALNWHDTAQEWSPEIPQTIWTMHRIEEQPLKLRFDWWNEKRKKKYIQQLASIIEDIMLYNLEFIYLYLVLYSSSASL